MKLIRSKRLRLIPLMGLFALLVLYVAAFGWKAYVESQNNKNKFLELKRQSFIIGQTNASFLAVQTATAYYFLKPDEIRLSELDIKLRNLRKNANELSLYPLLSPSARQTVEDLLKTCLMAQTTVFSGQAELEESPLKKEMEQRASMELLESAISGCGDSIALLGTLASDDLNLWQINNSTLIFRTQISLFIFICLVILVLIVTTGIVERMIRRSLRTLSEGTRELRNGNLNFRFKEITPDEIGGVKYDFNLMARKLETQSNELRKANEELRSQAEKLIEAHQHKDRFLSNMSHELRTPLNSIIGFSELIEARSELLPPEKMKGYASRILTAAEHLLSLITSLLDLAKSGAGTLKPVPSDFDLAFAVNEITEILQPLADKKALFLKTDLPDSLPVRADPRMLKQILINLVSNAIKFTEQGGITIRLSKDSNEHTPVVLSVEDTGIGIPESEHIHIFKDFHRVDNGAAHLVEGVGIGLALSKRLAALHEGNISFTSCYGKGSTFTLTLPASLRQSVPDQTTKNS